MNKISKLSKLCNSLRIGKNNLIGDNVKIMENVIIGNNNKIYDNTIIYPNTTIGNNNIFLNLKSIRMLFLGFSSGLPILLVFSTLSVWLVKAGVHRGMVTMFSWAGLAYSFKFIWTIFL